MHKLYICSIFFRTYFKNDWQKMNYLDALTRTLPIGSEDIEAAWNILIKQRICHFGMHWKEDRASKPLTFKTVVYSTGHWVLFRGTGTLVFFRLFIIYLYISQAEHPTTFPITSWLTFDDPIILDYSIFIHWPLSGCLVRRFFLSKASERCSIKKSRCSSIGYTDRNL